MKTFTGLYLSLILLVGTSDAFAGVCRMQNPIHPPRATADHPSNRNRHAYPLKAVNGVNGGTNGDAPTGGRPSNLVSVEPFLNSVEFLTGTRPGEDDPDVFYMIGKISVDLNIAEGMPGLDLAAATELVLVSGVRGHAEEAGIQPGDTITRIRAPPDMDQTTDGQSIQFIAQHLMQAAQQALEYNQTTIELELNRLVPAKQA